AGTDLPPDYLRRTGYRLPTEAEWEYACRADSTTARYYGRGDALLPRYAWSEGNSESRSWPCGLKKPNDLGLFDVHGNVWQWCQDPSSDYPEAWGNPLPDVEDRTPVADLLPRVARGGSFLERPETLRSGLRRHAYPSLRDQAFGFRIARTYR